MRSGAVPRTSNLMGAVSQLWNSLSPSQKQKYVHDDETDMGESYCIYESLSPIKTSENESELNETLTRDTKFVDKFPPDVSKKSKNDFEPHSISQKRRKVDQSCRATKTIKTENTNFEEITDNHDTLTIFDRTPNKCRVSPYDNSSRLNSIINRRKRARKILDFENVLDDERIPLYFEVPEVNVYTLLQDYDPPDDYAVPDIYDDEYLNYKWDFDEIADVEEADSSDYDPPKVPAKLRAFKIIHEPRTISDRLPVSLNFNELFGRKEKILNLTECAFKKHSFPNQPVRLIHTPKVIAQDNLLPNNIKSPNSVILDKKSKYKFNSITKSKNESEIFKSNARELQGKKNEKKDIKTIFQLFESMDSDKFISARPAGDLVMRFSDGNEDNTIYKIPVVTSDGACKILSVQPKK